MKKRIGIIGSGFSGFCTAVNFLNHKNYKVTIIDKSKIFGGVMYSPKIDNFYVDNGTHHFDNVPNNLAKIINKVMKNKVKKIEYKPQSIYNDKITKRYAYPSLTSLPKKTKDKIYKELIDLNKKYLEKTPKFSSMYDYFNKGYGKTAGKIFSKLFKNLYGVSPKIIESSIRRNSCMGRLKFLDDKEMMFLKKNYNYLENTLAARNNTEGNGKIGTSIYPDNQKGLRGWCDNSKNFLQNKGISIRNGIDIKKISENKNQVILKTNEGDMTFDKVIWCNSNLEQISKFCKFKFKDYSYGVPLVYFTYILKHKDLIKNFSYLHNFDSKRIFFRVHNAGFNTGQKDNNGNSFITVECFSSLNSKVWKNPENFKAQIWKDMKRLNLINKKSKLINVYIKKINSSLRLPKIGYLNYEKKLVKKFNKKFKNIMLEENKSFFRKEIYINYSSLAKKAMN